jgi:MFS family permease
MIAGPQLEPDDRGLRRLLPLAFAIVFVDNLFFAALTPLLPTLTAALGLDKGQAGILVGAYAAGVLIGALPGGLLASRLGVKRTAYAGVGLTAASALAFGLSGTLASLNALPTPPARRAAARLASPAAWGARSPGRRRPPGSSSARRGSGAGR